MKLVFKDILDEKTYSNTRVMIITGPYVVFNNIVIDTLVDMYDTSDDNYDTEYDIDEFDDFMSTSESVDASNRVDLKTFFDVIGTPSIMGKWICITNIAMLGQKQIDAVLEYIKKPSENGVLIIVANEWNEYKSLLRNKTLNNSNMAHIIQLSFPRTDVIKEIVKQMFLEHRIEVSHDAVELFMWHMGKEYDKYESTVQEICRCIKENKINRSEMANFMKDIQYYSLDDLVDEIIKPIQSSKTNRKKVVRIIASLLEDKKATNVVRELLKIIDTEIEYRVLINKGYIPIGIRYSFKEVIDNIQIDKFKNINEFKFRREAQLASKTSLRDWCYMKIILNEAVKNNRVSGARKEMLCKEALYRLSIRSTLSDNRIKNLVGEDNALNKEIEKIDNTRRRENE